MKLGEVDPDAYPYPTSKIKPNGKESGSFKDIELVEGGTSPPGYI